MKKTFCALAALLLFSLPLSAETTVKIDVKQSVEQISPYIYGQFIEHLGRCINGGIWAEMLEDRKFFYPVGSEESPWKSIYDCRMRMVKDGAFVGEHSAESYTTDEDEPRWLGVWQRDFAVRKGKTYSGYAWVKVSEGIEKVETIKNKDGKETKRMHYLSIYKRDIFFDAVITKPCKKDTGYRILESDSITPHGDNLLKNPIPITFMKIASGVTLEFRFDLKDYIVGNRVVVSAEKKQQLFRRILKDFGIGAKTNVGYGQFKQSR